MQRARARFPLPMSSRLLVKYQCDLERYQGKPSRKSGPPGALRESIFRPRSRWDSSFSASSSASRCCGPASHGRYLSWASLVSPGQLWSSCLLGRPHEDCLSDGLRLGAHGPAGRPDQLSPPCCGAFADEPLGTGIDEGNEQQPCSNDEHRKRDHDRSHVARQADPTSHLIVNRRRLGRRGLAVFIAVFGVAAALGSVLAMTIYTLLRSRGVDLYIAFPMALMAFFFGAVLVSLVLRIALGMAGLWRMRR